MIVGLGTDIVSMERIEKVLQRSPAQFIDRVCLEAEKQYLQTSGRDITAKLSKIWAVKEAAAKALGTGIAQGVAMKDIELKHNKFGRPELELKGLAKDRIDELVAKEKANIQVSLSDDKPWAQATVIIEKI